MEQTRSSEGVTVGRGPGIGADVPQRRTIAVPTRRLTREPASGSGVVDDQTAGGILVRLVEMAVERALTGPLQIACEQQVQRIFEDQLLTYEELAAESSLSVQSLQRLVGRGLLKSHTLGLNVRRIRRGDWQAFLGQEASRRDGQAR